MQIIFNRNLIFFSRIPNFSLQVVVVITEVILEVQQYCSFAEFDNRSALGNDSCVCFTIYNRDISFI